MNTAAPRTEVRPDNTLPLTPGPYLEGPPALEIRASYNGVLIGTRLLTDAVPAKRSRSSQGLNPTTNYVIGQSVRADAPAACELLGGNELPLVSRWGEGFLVNVTPQMTGDVAVGGKVYRLADYLAGRGCNFTLPPDGRARIECGAMSFGLSPTTRAEVLPRRWFAWRWTEQKFTLGSVLALGLFLIMIFAIPPDGASVSIDFSGLSRPFIPFTIKPAEPEAIPEILTQRPDTGTGTAGQAHAGDPGKLGDRNSKKTNRRFSIAGSGQDMHLGQQPQTVADIQNKGLLGALNAVQDSRFTSIFGRGTAAGEDKETILGNLVGDQFGDAYGIGGLAMVGSGSGGGGTGLATIGPSHRFGTVGPGYGGGPGIGQLARHIPRGPVVTQGIVTLRGSLDKEIIRRVVHLHMNEVKYCYDQELVRKASLEGRISVQFVIAGTGQVISSVLSSTTMGNLRVEKCVIDAVKRWSFPKPTGGGIAIVSYPFNFVAGSGG